MKNINLKSIACIIALGSSFLLKGQGSAVTPGSWQQTMGGTIAWIGKKLSSSASSDPSNGTMTFKIICDRTVEGVCFYADNGSSDTIERKTYIGHLLPSGNIYPVLPNFKLLDENMIPIVTGTLHAYYDNMVPSYPITTREHIFNFAP